MRLILVYYIDCHRVISRDFLYFYLCAWQLVQDDEWERYELRRKSVRFRLPRWFSSFFGVPMVSLALYYIVDNQAHFLCLLWFCFFLLLLFSVYIIGWSLRLYVESIPNLVIQPSCEYKGVKYNCGLSLACTLAGGLTKDLCNGGPLWQCCVPKSADNENSVQAPVFSLNDASKLSSFPPTIWTKEEKEITKQLTWLSDNNPNHFGLGHSKLCSWTVVSHVNHRCQHNNFSQRIVTSHWPWSCAVFYSFFFKFLYSFLFLYLQLIVWVGSP